MPIAKLSINRLVQDSQEYGSDNEHMVSRVFFDLTLDGKTITGLHADIKQSAGSSFETAPLEVSHPANYKGPFNFDAFQTIVEHYYRGLVGSTGKGICFSGGTNIRMQNNTFNQPATGEFEVKLSGGSW